MSCDPFGKSEKATSSAWGALTSAALFLVFASRPAFDLTSRLIPALTGGWDSVVVHSAVVFLLGLLIFYLAMSPWKQPKYLCDNNQ